MTMEHRLNKRKRVKVPVQLKLGLGQLEPGEIRNISQSGMYVKTSARPTASTCLEVGIDNRWISGASPEWFPMFIIHSTTEGVGLMMYKNTERVAKRVQELIL
jgi:hypothetical protein